MKLKLTPTAVRVLEARYLQKKGSKIIEKPEKLFERVASNIAQAEKLYNDDPEIAFHVFYDLMTSLDFLPNSPTMMNAGLPLQQLSACFVLPVGDSMESIFTTLKHTALIHKSGGGTGFSFSRIRPRNDFVHVTGGIASGPISFIKVFDSATEVIKQGGKRRGANMGILNIDHPDIMDFLTAKDKEGEIANFNLSVAATDRFMDALHKNKDYTLINPRNNRAVKKLKAKEVFERIANQAWKNGEPGIIFIDRINAKNPTPHVGLIESTNPCFHKDTLISTENGLEKIEDIYNRTGKIVIPVDKRVKGEKIKRNGREYYKNGLDYRKARVIKTGSKQTINLIFNNGQSLKVTPEHRILTETGFKEARHLLKDDKILIQSGKGRFADNDNLGRDMGFVLGWLTGDGWLTSDQKVVGMVSGPFEFYILQKITAILGKGIVNKRKNGIFQLLYKRKEIVEKIKMSGILSVKAHLKRVPCSIFTATEETVAGFIDGLFSSDGTVNYIDESHRDIRLSSSSYELIQDTQLLLLNCGIFSRIYDRTKKNQMQFPYITIEGESREYTSKPYYELIVTGNNLVSFNKFIGNLTNQDKNQKLKAIARPSRKTEKFMVKLERIEEGEEVDVYDVQEKDTHSLIAQGIVCHNCGEQPLLPYESCNLGSINLANMVKEGNINWNRLEKVVKHSVWFLDNVIDMNKYPIPEIAEMTLVNRKIGLGVMGWADMLIKLKMRYDSKEAIILAEKVMKFIKTKGVEQSVKIAEKRGTFRNWKGSTWDRKNIKIRNATITTIAPTGSISIIAGCSSGIEPLFALGFLRKISIGEFKELHPLFEKIARERKFFSEELKDRIIEKGSVKDIDEIPEDVKKLFITAMDVSPEWHIRIQGAFQKYTDNAVSKTINLPSESTVEDIKRSYLLAFKLGCKGITVYRDKSRDTQVLSAGRKDEQKEGKSQKLSPRQRPMYTQGITIRVQTSCGNMYVTINEDESGLCEVFATLGKTGGCPGAQTEAIARLISLSLRSGIDVKSVIKELRGIRCPSPCRMKEGLVLSCPDAIGIALTTYIKEIRPETNNGNGIKIDTLRINNMDVKQFFKEASDLKKTSDKFIAGHNDKNPLLCPDCGSTMFIAEGCSVCTVCGFSKCS
ncbi:MAG: TSCPD domain-containing protein [Spirochaetes bacterium]|nr:TSCPD domain-containing protein [Spirochaetota bacterium]